MALIEESPQIISAVLGVQGPTGDITPVALQAKADALAAAVTATEQAVIAADNAASTALSEASALASKNAAATSETNAASSANAANLAAQNIGTLAFTTVALMNADLAHDANTICLVTNDPTASNNGQYIKLLASGSGSWQKSAYVPPVADHAVTTKKINFSAVVGVASKNLFDKTATTAANYVNYLNGSLAALADTLASDYIPVLPNTAYAKTTNQQMAFYNASKTYISGLANPYTFTTPANCYFIRITVPSGKLNSEQVELGSISTDYAKYGSVLKDDNVPSEFVTERMLSFTPAMAQRSRNIFNKNAVINGKYVDSTNGILQVNASYSASDYIPVLPNTKYTRKIKERYAAYTANKVYISGANSVNTFTTPANAAYVRIALPTANVQAEQLEIGGITTSYIDYGTTLDISTLNKEGTIIKVATDGSGDYTNLSDAVAAITDSGKFKRYTIFVYPGVYDVFSTLKAGELAGAGIVLPNYVDVRGVGNKESIILKGELPNETTLDKSTRLSTLNVIYNNNLFNLTVTAKNCRYAVHADNSNTFKNYEQHIENCTFIHYGCATGLWDSIIAWGSGSASGAKEYFKNCSFKGNAGYTNHNNPNFAEDTYQEYSNCIFEGQMGGSCVQFISMDSNVKNKVVMKGCSFNTTISLTNNGTNPFEFDISGYSNTFTPQNLTSDAFINFKDEIICSVANKTITKGNVVKMYYNQCGPMDASANGNGKDSFYAGVCMKDCVAGETCYIKYAGFIGLTGIVAGLSVGNYIGLVSGALGVVGTYADAIGIIVNGNTMKFF